MSFIRNPYTLINWAMLTIGHVSSWEGKGKGKPSFRGEQAAWPKGFEVIWGDMGEYRGYIGLYRDTGKENGNYFVRVRGYFTVRVETRMEIKCRMKWTPGIS